MKRPDPVEFFLSFGLFFTLTVLITLAAWIAAHDNVMEVFH